MPDNFSAAIAENDFHDLIAFVAEYRSPKSDSNRVEVTANWAEAGQDASAVADGDIKTYWCTDGHQPGEGPTPARPDWLVMKFAQPVTATGIVIHGLQRYGPKHCELQVEDDGNGFRTVKAFDCPEMKPAKVTFDPVRGSRFRLMIYTAYDAGAPDNPRHVAIQEIEFEFAN